jgi:hypothetical protein
LPKWKQNKTKQNKKTIAHLVKEQRGLEATKAKKKQKKKCHYPNADLPQNQQKRNKTWN